MPVFFPMLLQDVSDGSLHLRGFLLKVGSGAAPFLGGIGGQFAAIDGEHVFPDQAQLVAGQQDFPKQLVDLFVQGRYKIGDGGEVRTRIAAERHEDDVLFTGLGDPPAGGDAPGIGKQNDLEQDLRIVGRRPRCFIAVSVIEDRQIQLAVDQMIKRIFEGAGKYLFLELDGDKLALCVGIRLVAGHGYSFIHGFKSNQVRNIYKGLRLTIQAF